MKPSVHLYVWILHNKIIVVVIILKDVSIIWVDYFLSLSARVSFFMIWKLNFCFSRLSEILHFFHFFVYILFIIFLRSPSSFFTGLINNKGNFYLFRHISLSSLFLLLFSVVERLVNGELDGYGYFVTESHFYIFIAYRERVSEQLFHWIQ